MLAVGRCTGAEDLRVGTVIPGRERPSEMSAVGLFTQTLVIRVHLPAAIEADAALALVARQYAEAMSNPVDFDLIRYALTRARDVDLAALFEVLFVFNYGGPSNAIEFGPVTSRALDTGGGFGDPNLVVTNHAVILSLGEGVDQGLRGELIVKSGLVTSETEAQLLETLWHILQELHDAAPGLPRQLP
jgi:hypothetical protein